MTVWPMETVFARRLDMSRTTLPDLVQTITHDQPGHRLGNCFAACVAAYFDLPLSEVPHFVEWGVWMANDASDRKLWFALFVGFCAAKGLMPEDIESLDAALPGEVVFVAGRSPRGVAHQVLYRDGELWFDPHPSRAGLLFRTEVMALRPVTHDHDPSTVLPEPTGSLIAEARRLYAPADAQEPAQEPRTGAGGPGVPDEGCEAVSGQQWGVVEAPQDGGE